MAVEDLITEGAVWNEVSKDTVLRIVLSKTSGDILVNTIDEEWENPGLISYANSHQVQPYISSIIDTSNILLYTFISARMIV